MLISDPFVKFRTIANFSTLCKVPFANNSDHYEFPHTANFPYCLKVYNVGKLAQCGNLTAQVQVSYTHCAKFFGFLSKPH